MPHTTLLDAAVQGAMIALFFSAIGLVAAYEESKKEVMTEPEAAWSGLFLAR